MRILRSLSIYLPILILICGSCNFNAETESGKQANALVNETSPYLLQHAYNPVSWFPWNDTALQKASEEDKLMIISIGYAACHWCHVMEEESFEDSTVAAMMNQYFVSVKVDREERPDIDQVYMDAAILANGRGGWPLNAITLPDGRPVFAGSYYPRDQWLRIIRQMAELYEKSPERLELVAEQLTKGIRAEAYPASMGQEALFTEKQLQQYFTNWLPELDFKYGGSRGAPKFPVTAKEQLLMQYYFHSGNDTILQALTTSLDQMAKGGIYDHLAGGFARYATDEAWKVPHFEKMLYDNAQLISLYSNAYRMTGREYYRQVVQETLAFVEAELYDPQGVFFSSLDADTEGEEGKFYTWTRTEVEDVLGKDAAWFMPLFHITEEGNWEAGKNILYLQDLPEPGAISEAAVTEAKKKMRNARNLRPRPALDDKVITAWNALMLEALLEASVALDAPELLEKALTTAHFLDKTMLQKNGQLYRTYKNGEVRIPAFLDDYALLIRAYLQLYQHTLDEQWLEKARLLTTFALDHFYDPAEQLFFYTSDLQSSLIARKKEVQDNVIPSSNSVMAHNLFILGNLDYRDDYLEISDQMLLKIAADMLQYPASYSYWASLFVQKVYPPYEVAILGHDYSAQLRKLRKPYLPNAIYLGGEDEGQMPLLKNKLVKGSTFIYVCQDKICQLPVREANAAIAQIKK